MLFANTKAWDDVSRASAVAEPPLGEQELADVFAGVWTSLSSVCPSIPADGYSYVDVGIDDRLMNSDYPDYERVLGWASRSERLVDRVWKGMLSTRQRMDMMVDDGYTRLGTVRVGLTPPGGWFRGDASLCSYKFRLEDVLLHEILHLLGISSTVRKLDDGRLKIGLEYGSVCFPGEFDTHIHDSDMHLLVSPNCEFRSAFDGKYYVHGVQLYVAPNEFSPGTTMSHLQNPGAVLSPFVYACDPSGPIQLKYEDAKVLGAVGVSCATDALPHATTLDYGGVQDPGGPSTAQNGSTLPGVSLVESGSPPTCSHSLSPWTVFLWSCCVLALASWR
jgi:hypothetical protein